MRGGDSGVKGVPKLFQGPQMISLSLSLYLECKHKQNERTWTQQKEGLYTEQL
jgi:hypothetical protein